ncbi:hypothetical protein [Halopseudomonas salegens]|uniref:Uncharacterized protein n=1 Tax=Halopseudomonas salegens TaxID=1434072 RepID=A0A1H2E0U9_9GAMM|nr:hypothetical protein [Halopseudomonas salegens]SDT88701.1 hypothetical protein SAMN05216210_0194 [Halopseudomonas salegens]
MMHDWTLLTLIVDWANGTITIAFRNCQSQEVFLIAEGLIDLRVPKREEWGGSVSVNEVDGPKVLQNGSLYFSIEMQSGDKIEMEARSISLPDG